MTVIVIINFGIYSGSFIEKDNFFESVTLVGRCCWELSPRFVDRDSDLWLNVCGVIRSSLSGLRL